MKKRTILAIVPFLLVGCANMTEGEKNAAIGCGAGLAAGAVGDYAIATPLSGLLPLVGCAVGGAAGYFISDQKDSTVDVGKPVPHQ